MGVLLEVPVTVTKADNPEGLPLLGPARSGTKALR